MTRGGQSRSLYDSLDERKLSIIVHSLFSSWMLSFLFEGRILYALAHDFDFDPTALVFGGIAAHLAGALLCGFLIRTKRAARRLFLCSYPFFIVASAAFFFPPSLFWNLGILTSSLLAGGCVAAWGFYFKSGTPKNERIKTAADVLICSNVLMILLNMVAIHISPRIGLGLSMTMLVGAFLFALRLPVEVDTASHASPGQNEGSNNITGILAFLCVFIALITINAGLMYQVINPAFAHLEWLTSWYWAIPYIAALFVMRNLPRRISRGYLLFVAIAMIGLSFIGLMSLDRSAASYLVVNTLMLGACGIYDLFWWSILGEMLEFHRNPARVLGIGLSANLLGILLGGLIGSGAISTDMGGSSPTLLALAVVCVTLALLPPLHMHLSSLLKDHVYLAAYSELPAPVQKGQVDRAACFGNLSEREGQVASLLLQGKTYRRIAGELCISENTVKYYVKNIYSKLSIQSRAELIDMALNRRGFGTS